MKKQIKQLLLCALTVVTILSGCAKGSTKYPGTWKSIMYGYDGKKTTTNDELSETTMTLTSDGKGTLDFLGEQDVTWKETSEGISVTYNGNTYSASMNGNVLEFLVEGYMTIYFTKDGEEAKWDHEPNLEESNIANELLGSAAPSGQ